MPPSLAPLAPLLLGTLLLRPYVFAFLAVFAWAATRDLGAICADAWRWQKNGGRY